MKANKLISGYKLYSTLEFYNAYQSLIKFSPYFFKLIKTSCSKFYIAYFLISDQSLMLTSTPAGISISYNDSIVFGVIFLIITNR